jgi:23S rRNA pseudouridine955/2504/2580 synthase
MTVTTREVTNDEADIRLDRWFRRHYPGVTQGALQKLCRTGQIRVDGKRAETATRLSPGPRPSPHPRAAKTRRRPRRPRPAKIGDLP